MPEEFELNPFEACGEVSFLRGSLLRRANRYHCRYTICGDLTHISWPHRARRPRREAQLWQQTCFELFLARETDESYLELNFSPSGNWNAYGFTGYRQGMKEADRIDSVEITSKLERHNRRRLDVEFNCHHNSFNNSALSIGISAVIENSAGRLCYFALCHPGSKADFHNRDSFKLKLIDPDKTSL
jgi:hypothetical protein